MTTPAEPEQDGPERNDPEQGAPSASTASTDDTSGTAVPAQADAGADADTEAASASVPASAETSPQPLEPAPDTAPVRPRRRFRWLRVLAGVTALLVLVLGGGTWYLYQRLNGNITTDTVTENELRVHASDRPAEGPTSAENILLIGSDNRGNGNEKYGQDTGTQRSDTTILLHLAADRHTATAMSIPRDLMVNVPSCTGPDGSTVPARFEQFNWAFERGGAACTIRTVENMTGVRIDHHLIVDFTGFKRIVNAVDGVDVCLTEPVHDAKAHLDLPAGRQKLDGEQALGYVRARYSIGDGSDTGRMDRQQDFLASLLKKVRSNGVLLNPMKLYPVLDAATSSLTADPGLDSLSELYGLAHSIQRIPTGAVHFLTLPEEPWVQDRNRDQLVQPDADELFNALRDDRPVNVTGDSATSTAGGTAAAGSPASGTPTASGTPSGSRSADATSSPSSGSTGPTGSSTSTSSGAQANTPSGTPSAAPTYRGTTANRDICGKER